MQINGYTESSFEFNGESRPVYIGGDGPGVVIMHEIPGMTPQVLAFANRVKAAGFCVALPLLFGTPEKKLSLSYAMTQITRACIGKEFSVLASNESSPVTNWLRALCRDLHEKQGGPGVGALGMCLTGNFALSLMVDPSVMAPVLSQPSLPFALTAEKKQALHISDEDLEVVKKRVANEDIKVIGLKFSHDMSCPKARFDRLEKELGDGFENITIDSSWGNPHKNKPYAHSVLTNDLIDKEGHPTRQALDRVLEYFDQQLKPEQAAAKSTQT